VDRPRPPIKR